MKGYTLEELKLEEIGFVKDESVSTPDTYRYTVKTENEIPIEFVIEGVSLMGFALDNGDVKGGDSFMYVVYTVVNGNKGIVIADELSHEELARFIDKIVGLN